MKEEGKEGRREAFSFITIVQEYRSKGQHSKSPAFCWLYHCLLKVVVLFWCETITF